MKTKSVLENVYIYFYKLRYCWVTAFLNSTQEGVSKGKNMSKNIIVSTKICQILR